MDRNRPFGSILDPVGTSESKGRKGLGNDAAGTEAPKLPKLTPPLDALRWKHAIPKSLQQFYIIVASYFLATCGVTVISASFVVFGLP